MKQVVFWAFAGFFLSGQTVLAQLPDSLPATLTLNRFLKDVASFHPAAVNARILPDQAAAVLTSARGAFDPKLYADWEQKSFDGKNYFTVGSSGLKMQTPYALALKSEFNIARGQFLNPENKLPSEGQAVVGVSLPLLNGLLIDSERAGLQQARLGLLSGEVQQRVQMNDLLFRAGLAYVDWAIAFNQVGIFRQAVDIARQRLDIMVESFRQGDKPAVDTLETFIQWQNRLFDLNESALELANTAQTLETFFWTPGQTPQGRGVASEKQPELMPDSSDALPPALDAFLTGLTDRHPELRQLQLDLQTLAVDRRLAAEQFKPRLDVSYHFLAAGTDFLSPVNGGGGAFLRDLLTENYKWGLNFLSFLCAKSRGKSSK
ncbi:MAG: TolC family protein [Haliscomenobacter sp.]|nr:TolC family protein [Haliscomenobacter sp.]